MPYIDIIGYDRAEGQLKEMYDDLIQSRGKLAHVHTAQSLNPDTIVPSMELYMNIMYKNSPLSRAQREMIGTVVSSANECAYCVAHHSIALNHFWKDDARIAALLEDIYEADLPETDLLLCEFAYQLTKEPGNAAGHESMIRELKEMGVSDRAILDANLVVAYFNFVNRIVMGTGIEEEADGPGGYAFE